jgi:3-keto-5-aminohexanoate cleavage enzyme
MAIPNLQSTELRAPATDPGPLIITVAPNGAHKTPADHPSLPLTPDAIAATARACLDAGAAMLHLHIRGPDGRHSLDAATYRVAIQAVRQVVGEDLVVQITTEAGNRYSPLQQMAVVREVRPEAVSFSLRELAMETAAEGLLAQFLSWLTRERIMAQVILYDVADIRRWRDLRRRGVVPEAPWFVLYVLGRYTLGQTSSPRDLLPLLLAADWAYPWAVCAFGREEHSCAMAAAALGGHVRVGFENNVCLKDGAIARDNTALIAQAAQGAAMLGRPLADADFIRRLFSGRLRRQDASPTADR